MVFLLIWAIFVASCKEKTQHESAKVSPQWYRNSIIYNLDVDIFNDSDGDGIGDFKGLISKLPYLDSLGVEVIWLSPFQPSPDKDDGYDVSDYYGIDSRLGTMNDFENFMRVAAKHKIKVVMDMVLNHTSVNHPWFIQARSDSSRQAQSRYVWSKTKPKDFDKGMVFEGYQTETWTFDEVAQKFYFHRFYDFQPDLNYQNKEVQKEAIKVLQYWAAKGIKGFRLDAVPFIIDVPESGAENPAKMFGVLDSLVRGAKAADKETLLLGEANVDPKENELYFGKQGERLNMMFNFYANQYLFYSMAEQDPKTFIQALEDTRKKPGSAQWAYFLRNHDEIDLGRLSKSQRQKVYDEFGPQSNMQLYNRGIRRRLAPMLHQPERIKMAYSILYALPGAPVIRSGEEIGMGDDLTLAERLAVRTPMQWNLKTNAGFSTAKKTLRPVISMGEYAYQKVNVSSQLLDSNSLLQHIKNLIALRRANPEIGMADWKMIDLHHPELFAIEYQLKDGKLLIIHNFSQKEINMDLSDLGRVTKLFGSRNSNAQKGLLPGFGQLWLKYNQP